MDIPSQIMEVRDGLINSIGRSIGVWGLNETLGRIFGLLYFADQPLSLEEMAEELMVSKATISINIRILEGLKCVEKIWKKGSRKDYYIVERDFNKIFQEIIRTNAMSELLIQKEAIADGMAGYEQILKNSDSSEIKEQAKRELAKVHELAKWIQLGEKWIRFFMDVDLEEGIQAPIQKIEVEWEDE